MKLKLKGGFSYPIFVSREASKSEKGEKRHAYLEIPILTLYMYIYIWPCCRVVIEPCIGDLEF